MVYLRDLMPALANKHYFNYGGQGPLPSTSLDAIKSSWDKIQTLGPFTNLVWPYINSEKESTRQILSEKCNTPPNRLALTENVTSGCILPLLGIKFEKGERLLISDSEHPGVIAACFELAKSQNIPIDILKVQQFKSGFENKDKTNSLVLDALEKELRPSTKLLVISHLLWNTGQIMPIEKISSRLSKHSNSPFLLVDGAQSFGQIPIGKAADCSDIYAFTGHKWAFGPEGLGGVAISNRIIFNTKPTLIGWRSLKNESIFKENQSDYLHKDSRRFEIATSCIPLFAGLRKSIQTIEEFGTPEERISKIRKMSSNLWQKLNDIKGVNTLLNEPPPAGLVSFYLPEKYTTSQIVNFLGERNIWIRDLKNPNCLRACVHITTLEEEINLLVDAIREIIVT